MPMKVFHAPALFCLLAVSCLIRGETARASDADTIGATALKQADPTLTGGSVAVIQAEASLTSGTAGEHFHIYQQRRRYCHLLY